MASSATRAALLLVLLAAGPAFGAVTCRLSAGSTLAFGPYDVLSPLPTDTLGTIQVVCERNGGPRNVTVTMMLGQGLHGTSVQSRRLRHTGGGSQMLAYNLFSDVSRTSPWGFSPGVDTVSQTVSIDNKDTATMAFTIYGRIPARQDGVAGSYADRVQVTITP